MKKVIDKQNLLVKLTDKNDIQWKKSALLVTANRWSHDDSHSYPIGIFKTMESAKKKAKQEFFDRGGKYGVTIFATKNASAKLIEIYEIISPYKDKIKGAQAKK